MSISVFNGTASLQRLTLLGLILGSVLLGVACSSPEQEELPPHVPTVLWTKVEKAGTASPEFTGVIVAKVESTLGFKISGTVSAVLVDVGSKVASGDLLMTLDEAKAQYAVDAAKADVNNAQTRLSMALQDEARVSKLVEANAATASELDILTSNRQAASAAVDLAKTNLLRAQEQHSYTQIKSPIDGVVTQLSSDLGDIISAGQPMLTVANPDTQEVTVDVPADRVSKVVVGQFALVRAELNPSATATGKITRISPVADAATRTTKVTVNLIEPFTSVRIGSTVNVTLFFAAANYLIVPKRAVVSSDEGAVVWVLNSENEHTVVNKMPVQLDAQGRVLPSDQLMQGVSVVLAGTASLREGMAVIPAEEMSHE